MAAAREPIALKCTQCNRRNYTSTKKKQAVKLTLSKYCAFDRAHTDHEESKIK